MTTNLKEKDLEEKAFGLGYLLMRHNKPRSYHFVWGEKITPESKGKTILVTESGISVYLDEGGKWADKLHYPDADSTMRSSGSAYEEDGTIWFQTENMTYAEADAWLDLAGMNPQKITNTLTAMEQELEEGN